MAATTPAITPTPTGPFANSLAPDTPTSLASASHAVGSKALAPLAAAAAAFRASHSPRSPKSMSPRASPQPPAAVVDQPSQDRPAEKTSEPAPSSTAAGVLETSKEAISKLSQPLAQAVQSIVIPENGVSATSASPVSPTSMRSVDIKAPTVTAPTQAPSIPQIEPAPTTGDAPAARPVVDPGIAEEGGSRAFTFPPPPLEDPRQQPQRNMSLPNAGYVHGSPKSPAAKKHKCPYCSTVFTRHHNLKSHLLTHSQEKPFECTQCKSRFRRLHDLKRHTKLHTGERPHECTTCGRKFARGDALARHSKGQGGCAGRRSSYDDGGDGSRVDGMEGVVYTDEPDNMDEEEMEMDGRRRVSEPAKRGSVGRRDSSHRHSSTFPGPSGQVGGGAAVAPMYPPPSLGQSRDPSLSSQAPTVQPFNTSASVFQHSNISESPKPISPGEQARGHPNQRPAQQPPFQSGLPPPNPSLSGATSSGPPQLPSLPRFPEMAGPPSGPQHKHMPSGTTGSHPGSVSSHSGSGASSREIIGGGHPDVWNYVRDIEARMNRLQEEHKTTVGRMDADYRAKIAQLESEQLNYKNQIGTLNSEISELKTKLDNRA